MAKRVKDSQEVTTIEIGSLTPEKYEELIKTITLNTEEIIGLKLDVAKVKSRLGL